MPTLAAAIRAEVKKLAGREVKKALKAMRRVQKQVKGLRLDNKSQQRAIEGIERRVSRAGARVGAGIMGAERRVAGISGEAIYALRSRLEMTREQFAKAVGVSPGSIFGWEKGRTFPRGSSVAKLDALRKQGVRRIRAGAEEASSAATRARKVVRKKIRRARRRF